MLLRFGLPAVLAALLGAWLLSALGTLPALHAYTAFGHRFEILPLKLVIGVLLLLFALALLERDGRLMVVAWLGGVASVAFFGVISGRLAGLAAQFVDILI